MQRFVLGALAKEGMTQRLLSLKMDVSEGTIDSIKKGKFDKLSEKMMEKCLRHFRLGEWKIRRTENFVAITSLCEEARVDGRMVAVAGYTGAGKTTALDWVARNTPEAYYVLCDKTMSGTAFLMAIQESLMGSRATGTTPSERIRSITDYMRNREDWAVLLLDDAGKLQTTPMLYLQIIYDQLGGDGGIVLAGTEQLKYTFDRLVARKANGFPELYRRIGYWQPLYPISEALARGICEEYGIADKHAQQYIVSHIKDYGSLQNIIENACKFSIRNGGAAITREVLVDLHVGDAGWRA